MARKTLKNQLQKLTELYFQLKQLKNEYEQLKTEVMPKINDKVDLGDAIVAKTIYTETRLMLPTSLKQKLKKKYGKQIEIERLTIRRKEV